jgi:hypothetical protein
MLPDGLSGGVGWTALAIAVAVWWMLERMQFDLHWVLPAAALAGLGAQALGWS